MRVLMLGWEFPPHISGGLGTACQGIVQGLMARGAEVLFVLPRLLGGEDGSGAWLMSAGDVPLAPDLALPAEQAAQLSGRLQLSYVDSPLQPYQTATDYSTMLRRIRRGVPRPTSGDRHAESSTTVFEGGYGPNLAAEVERFARAVAEIARREQFDVIHAHDWMTFPAGLLARRVSGQPLVCHVHASEFDRSGPDGDAGIFAIERAALASADRVVAVSEYTREVLARHYVVDEARVRVVHNAVQREQARARSQVASDGAPTVLFLGRLTRQKGPETFIDAAALIAARHSNVRFVVAGDGALRHELVEQAQHAGLAQSIRFPGFLNRAEVERAYARADVYVMPSVSEPFGIAPLEALALDTPVVVSRASGVTEAIPSALTFEPGNAHDLASKIESVLFDPQHARALVERGQHELKQLRWERSAERLLEIYAEVALESSHS